MSESASRAARPSKIARDKSRPCWNTPSPRHRLRCVRSFLFLLSPSRSPARKPTTTNASGRAAGSWQRNCQRRCRRARMWATTTRSTSSQSSFRQRWPTAAQEPGAGLHLRHPRTPRCLADLLPGELPGLPPSVRGRMRFVCSACHCCRSRAERRAGASNSTSTSTSGTPDSGDDDAGTPTEDPSRDPTESHASIPGTPLPSSASVPTAGAATPIPRPGGENSAPGRAGGKIAQVLALGSLTLAMAL